MSGLPDLTMLVPVRDGATAAMTCAELDAQTLPAEHFDVVLVSATPLPDRIRRWAERRANVAVAVDLETARAAARGPHVVVLAADDRLFTFGLRVLVDTVRDSGADLVVGVRNDDIRSAQWLVRADDHPTTEGSVVATRTGSTGETVAVTSRPVARVAGPTAAGSTPPHVDLDQPSIRWSGSTLSLALAVTVVDPDDTGLDDTGSNRPGGNPRPEGEPGVLLVARGQKVPQERSLPAEVALRRTGLDDGWGLTVRADLDLDPRSTVLPGGGRWMPQLRLIWPDRELLIPVPGPAAPLPGALLSGRPVAVRSADGALLIDQTATTTATVGALRVADSTLVDTVDGLVLRVALPELHVVGDGTLAGQLMAGGQVGPATVECTDGRATLVAPLVLSTGRAEIATVFGGPRTPSGLDVELASDGTCALVPHHRDVSFQRPEPVSEPAPEPPRAERPAPPSKAPFRHRAFRALRRRLRSRSSAS